MSGVVWYAFNFGSYSTDTGRLSCEAHGAYIQLIAEYYNTGEPMPDDDEQIAILVKLSPQRWKVVRKSLERFFRIEDGYWFHDRIKEEIEKANTKHAASIAKAKHAAEAKYGRASVKDAPSTPVAKPKPAPRKPVQSSKPPDSTLTSTLSSERVDARAQDSENGSVGQEENPLGTMLDPNWVPDAAGIEFARSQGMDTDETIKAELLAFHDRHSASGTMSRNWPGSWRTWCKRFAERQAEKPKAPPPRVEVNNTPTDSNWDWACAQWAKGASFWSHKSLGPAPDQTGCRCPKKFLEKYHIDPATGQVAEPSETET